MNINHEAIYQNLISTFDLGQKVLFDDLVFKIIKEPIFQGEDKPEITNIFKRVKIKLRSRINKEIEKKNSKGDYSRFYFDSNELYLIGCAYIYNDDTDSDVKIKRLLSNSYYIEQELCRINDYDFEKICALLLKEIGCKVFRVTRKSCDGGVDFYGTSIVNERTIEFMDNKRFLENANIHFIGQSKRYTGKNSIKPKDIREFLGSIFILEFSQGWDLQNKLNIKNLPRKYIKPVEPKIPIFMTTSYFTQNAENLCFELGIVIKSGEDISRWLAFNVFSDVEIDELKIRNILINYVNTYEIENSK